MSNNPPLPELPPDLEATLFREEPLVKAPVRAAPRPQPDPDLPDPGRYENQRYSKKRTQPRRREKLLDRDDWKTIAVTAGVTGLVAFIGCFLGIMAGLWAT